MKEKLNELIEKYSFRNESYSGYFYDENNKEYSMENEIQELFENSDIKYKLDVSDCFESCGYGCDMLSIAWIENDEIFMENILLEYY